MDSDEKDILLILALIDSPAKNKIGSITSTDPVAESTAQVTLAAKLDTKYLNETRASWTRVVGKVFSLHVVVLKVVEVRYSVEVLLRGAPVVEGRPGGEAVLHLQRRRVLHPVHQ
ncbi:unnamed protein product, partial [Leptidea sinapis]